MNLDISTWNSRQNQQAKVCRGQITAFVHPVSFLYVDQQFVSNNQLFIYKNGFNC
jgi:hypothetical protein